jgi:hypothetical protein
LNTEEIDDRHEQVMSSDDPVVLMKGKRLEVFRIKSDLWISEVVLISGILRYEMHYHTVGPRFTSDPPHFLLQTSGITHCTVSDAVPDTIKVHPNLEAWGSYYEYTILLLGLPVIHVAKNQRRGSSEYVIDGV